MCVKVFAGVAIVRFIVARAAVATTQATAAVVVLATLHTVDKPCGSDSNLGQIDGLQLGSCTASE